MIAQTGPEFWHNGDEGVSVKVAFRPFEPRRKPREPEPDGLSAARGIGFAVLLSCALILLVIEAASNFYR